MTRNDLLAGTGSVLPAASVACASSSWIPGVRPESVIGFVQGAQAPPSKRHSNVALFSSDSSANVTEVAVTGRPDGGPPVIRAPGGVRSTSKENEAGSSSSLARTLNV